MRGMVGEPDGSRILRAEIKGSARQAASLGKRLAADLLAQGAADILRRLQD